MTDKERENREELFKLMQENPGLPVVPLVDGEIPKYDWGAWLGDVGCVYVGEYLFFGTDDIVELRRDNDSSLWFFLRDCFSKGLISDIPEDENGRRNVYNALPWKKAIIICIDPPEE